MSLLRSRKHRYKMDKTKRDRCDATLRIYVILIKHTSFTGKGIAYGTEFPFASATTSSTEGPEPGMDIAPPILSRRRRRRRRTLEMRFFTKKSEDFP